MSTDTHLSLFFAFSDGVPYRTGRTGRTDRTGRTGRTGHRLSDLSDKGGYDKRLTQGPRRGPWPPEGEPLFLHH